MRLKQCTSPERSDDITVEGRTRVDQKLRSKPGISGPRPELVNDVFGIGQTDFLDAVWGVDN
jgi:hypothetical protein